MAALVEQLGRIGENDHAGMDRPVYSRAWREAQDFVAAAMTQAGLSVSQDQAGNVFGRLEGQSAEGTVLTGSHIDSVIDGGKYDGALGVLSGLAALETLIATGTKPRRPVEVVSLCEEEGSRFPGAAYFGSRAILGLIAENELTDLRDAQGVTIEQAAREVGLDLRQLAECRRSDIACFLELHIEQGRRLQEAEVQIGVVQSIAGLKWLKVLVQGQTDHAGATEMRHRKDAFQGAAAMATAIDAAVRSRGGVSVATIGQVEVRPGAPNIVPGTVEFTVDFRDTSQSSVDGLETDIRDACTRVARDSGLEVTFDLVRDTPPLALDSSMKHVIEEAVAAGGFTSMPLDSGAGHDSQTIGKQIPTGMIFVPSRDGRSHSPAEYTSPADCAAGATVLANALAHLAWDN
ncbi:Zn-dependent hydrolase [Ornithinimicrobium sp. Y1694]|uniref:Zn-dependent hydrolase n=1 Tax=Ornithinimicrobium sp. Y1694 TaxID=3418590 RepID=UPI003CFA8DF0